MDIPLAMTNNVLASRDGSVHGAAPCISQIFAGKVFWSIHSVEYIRSRSSRRSNEAMPTIDESSLSKIEAKFAQGLTSADILDVFAENGVALSEATLRKYVQLGLLPRSVRVGRKGKHRGSQGIYPVSVVREIVRIKEMMAQSYTIEQIQREVLFMRAELQQLEQALGKIFGKLDGVLKERRKEAVAQSVARDVKDARGISRDLMSRLSQIEARLSSRARIERVAAS